MVITQPTVDDFSDTTVMRVIRKIVNYICSDSGLVAQINDNDITGFTSSYKDNILKIDATKGDGSKLPVCNVTIEGGGSSTGNPYPTAVNGTVGVDGNIKFTITMSSGNPLTTTINMSYFASTADLSDLQKQVTGIKPSVTTNLETSPPTITVAVNGTSSTANLPSFSGSEWEEIDLSNMPTDFSQDDILAISFTGSLSLTVKNLSIPPNFITVPIKANPYNAKMTMSTSFETDYQYLGIVALYYVGDANRFNSQDTIFQINGYLYKFSDNTHKDAFIAIDRSNVSSYISKMFRRKLKN